VRRLVSLHRISPRLPPSASLYASIATRAIPRTRHEDRIQVPEKSGPQPGCGPIFGQVLSACEYYRALNWNEGRTALV